MTYEWLRTTKQLWKAVAAYLSAGSMASAGLVAIIADDEAVRFIAYEVATGCVLLAIGFAALVRCRVCDEFVMISAFRGSGDPFGIMRRLKTCPNCGAATNDEKLY